MSHFDVTNEREWRNIHLRLSDEKGFETGPNGSIALVIHAMVINTISIATAVRQRYAATLLPFISMQVVDVENVEFKGTHHETCGVDALGVRKQLLYQLVLALFETLNSKRHSSERRNLFLGVA